MLKYKKLVAREGLIFLSIILLAIVSINLPDTVTVMEAEKSFDSAIEMKLKITDTKDDTIYTVIIKKSQFEKNLEGKNFTYAEVLKELGNRGKLEETDLNFIKIDRSIASLKETIYLILLASYPFYLTLRFIFWAIGTLRGSET